jgi:hypothetical protein
METALYYISLLFVLKIFILKEQCSDKSGRDI